MRDEYIERTRGLPLAMYFNTTVPESNFDDVSMLVRYFIRRCDDVRLASFQLQADMGARAPRSTSTPCGSVMRGASAMGMRS